MITIDYDKCIACGECARDCDGELLKSSDGKPQLIPGGRCSECGHCIAVCPVGAVSDVNEAAMREVKELDAIPHTLAADALLGAIMARRSVRRFKQQPVEWEKLAAMIEAGRYTPTASNLQGNSYAVVTERITELRHIIVDSLAAQARALGDDADERAKRYAARYLYMQEHIEQDLLFFNGPAIIFVISDTDCDGALAAANMELMACAQGLGMVYCGFAKRGVNASEQARALLNIPSGKSVSTCLIIGYPDVTYHRTVPRRPARITRL